MKIIETKTTTTMYDTNGKQISVVRKEQTVVEDNQVFRPVSREEGIKVQKVIADYKNEFQLKKEMRDAMQNKTQKSRIVVFDIETRGFQANTPISMMHITGIPRPGKSNLAMDLFLAAAEKQYISDTQINKSPMRQQRKPKRHNRPRS